MKIIFMGTPDFAVPSLNALAAGPHEVIAAVTSPDKASGRGLKLNYCEVKKAALQRGIPVLQPESLRSPEFHEQLKALNADIFVVVAFRILPQAVFEIPVLGAVNAHGSLLPKYRGAAPIQWALYHGEKETGISTFRIARSVDTGGILLQKRIPILDDDTAGTLYDKMKVLAAAALSETLDGLVSGTLKPVPQDDSLATGAPKIFPELGELDLSRSAKDLVNHIRAFDPFPGCWFMHRGNKIKIFGAQALEGGSGTPGRINIIDRKTFHIECGEGVLLPLNLQLPGRRVMDRAAFMNGYSLDAEAV